MVDMQTCQKKVTDETVPQFKTEYKTLQTEVMEDVIGFLEAYCVNAETSGRREALAQTLHQNSLMGEAELSRHKFQQLQTWFQIQDHECESSA